MGRVVDKGALPAPTSQPTPPEIEHVHRAAEFEEQRVVEKGALPAPTLLPTPPEIEHVHRAEDFEEQRVVEKGALPAPTLQNASQHHPTPPEIEHVHGAKAFEEQRAMCSVHDSDKDDCGYSGIHKAACLARGCCWAAAEASGVPWCFHK